MVEKWFEYMPPLIIFKGKRQEWLYGSPHNTMVRVSDNGLIIRDLGKMLIAQLPKDDTRLHLLLLDGHSSQVFNVEFHHLMRKHNVELPCILDKVFLQEPQISLR